MIRNCFTSETQVVEIVFDELVKYDDEEEKLHLLAQQISDETHVPKSSIFTGEYNFRIANWHKIDNDYYYFKQAQDYYTFFTELLGEFISMYFDLDTVHYQIAKLKVKDEEEQYGIISKNFCTEGYIYKTLSEYISESSELCFYERDLRILDEIKCICSSEEEFRLLQDDLKKLIIRHFYNTQCDGGNGHNIMLKSNNEGIRLATLYDYGFAYLDYEGMYRHIWDIGELNIKDKKTQELFRNDPRFQELLYKLMDADMKYFLSQIEDTHKVIVPKNDRNHYLRYAERVKKLVLENKLIK